MSPDERTPWDGWTPGDGPRDSMTEDRIRAVFEEPIVPLSPPPGTWERIQTDATRRRRARRLMTAGSAAAVVALFAGGLAWLTGPGDDPTPPTPVPPATASASATTPAPSPTREPTGEPSEPTGGTTSGALLLPQGGPVPRGFVAVSVTTAARGLVYALGTAPCSTAPCTSLVRSSDGGTTWAGMPAPEAELSPAVTGTQGTDGVTANTVTDVRFATPLDGWAFGGALWQTHDGAVTWEKVPGIKGRVLDLATDGDDVWAVTSTCVEGPCADGVQVLRAGAGDSGFTPAMSRLHPDSLDVHLVGGDGTMALTVGGPESQLFLARDDGRWLRVATPCAPAGVHDEGDLLALAPPAEGRGTLLAFCGDAAAGSLHVVTQRSTDEGRTWAGQSDDVTVPDGTFSGTAVTPDVVLLASGNPDLGGALRVSRDGGRSYRTPDVDAPRAGWRWVGAAGGGRVLALPLDATGEIYVSTDSGASFVAQPIR